MRLIPVLCRLIWCLGAGSVAALVVVEIQDARLGLGTLATLAGTMGGVTTALWYVYAKPESLSVLRLGAAFFVGAVVWLFMTNPYLMMFGFGVVAALWLPVVVVCMLGVTFRLIIIGTAWAATPS